MVFDPAVAPRTRSAFMAWYEHQPNWTESHCADPAIPSVRLRAWFDEMIKSFPPINGPLASPSPNVDDPHTTDYSLGRAAIYAAFSWSMAEEAYRTTVELAMKHGVGFFDVSATDGDVAVPDKNGEYIRLSG